MSRRISLIIILLIFLLSNCFPARELRPPEKIDPDQIIEILRSDEKSLNSAAISLKFEFSGKGKRFSTEAEVFYKEPDAFTVYFKSSSHLNVFKSVMKSDSVLFYLPERNEYYLDSYENFSQTKGWEWGIELEDFLNLVIGKNGFEEAPLRFEKREGNDLIYVSEDEFWEKKFWVDDRKNQLTKSEWTNKNSNQILRIDYKKYKDYDGRKLPGFLETRILPEKETLKVRFNKRKINIPLSEKIFNITIPNDAHQVWLKEKD